MNTVRLNAYAKLNLTLDVLGTRDGYHLLDSLVTTIDVSDRVILKKRRDGAAKIVMHGCGSEAIPPEENLALRAAERFMERFRTTGADITVYKNIPMGAGMGGSSADTAAVIKGMGMLYEIEEKSALLSLANSLGSDTGYLLEGGLCRMRGRGERFDPLPFLPLPFLLLCPKEGVSTAACYSAFDGLGLSGGKRTERALSLLSEGNLPWAAKLFGNDLYPAAKSLCPAAEDALLSLKAFSPLGVAMTGSGSAAFALFETVELAEWAKSRYRGPHRAILAKSVPKVPLGDEIQS